MLNTVPKTEHINGGWGRGGRELGWEGKELGMTFYVF